MRGTGKTSLMNRLQGVPMPAEYQPTPEIQISTINWSTKDTAQQVKVEAWDVVDVGISKQHSADTGADDLAGIAPSRHVRKAKKRWEKEKMKQRESQVVIGLGQSPAI
jgi:GTPase SAR1 family protein